MSKYDQDEFDAEEAKYEAAMRKNIESYPIWQEKLADWKWQAVADKLRALEIKISRQEFVQLAEKLPSALAVGNKFMDKVPVGKGFKMLNNLGFIWAAMEFLWKEWVEHLSLENFWVEMDITYGDWHDYHADIHEAYGYCVQHWEEFLIAPYFREGVAYEKAATWRTMTQENCVDIALRYTLELMMDGAKKDGKLSLEMVALFHKLGQKLLKVEEKNAYYALAQIWLHLVNGNEEAVENAVAEYKERFAESVGGVYEMVADFYENPPAYAYTPANTQRSYEYKIKLLGSIDPDA